MRTTRPVSCCPHCGGVSGFITNIVLKAVRATTWDGEDVDTDRYVLASETNPKCMDCDRPVRSLFKAA